MQKIILVVEDNNELRDFLIKILSANNFKVFSASDGAEALEAVEKYLPDLVLLDFGLPKVSGETVCVKIKKDHPKTIVIVLTGKSESSDVVHALQIGADDYMSKPFNEEELIARIDVKFKTIPSGQIKPKPETSTPKEVELGKITLRESIVLVAIRLALTEALFGFLLILFSIIYSFINSYLNSTNLSILYFITLAVTLLMNVVMVTLIALRWSSVYTEITKEGVVKHSGLFHKKEQKYACNFIEATTLNQSFWGLIFNYGTIKLYDPTLKNQINLFDIPNPKKNSEKIQKLVSTNTNKPITFLAR